jgi:hypothetical protein
VADVEVIRVAQSIAPAAAVGAISPNAQPAASRTESDSARSGSARSNGAATASAVEMMTRAHDARATWNGFPGFSADLEIADNGATSSGRLTVSADGKLNLTSSSGAVKEWVQRTLESTVQHRIVATERTYDVSFADDEINHPLGRLIRINDDQLMGSSYRIRDDVITEVHRTMGDSRFTITVTDVSRNPEGKHLPKSYSVSFWDAKTGNLKSTNTVFDEWARVGRWELPKRLLSVETRDDARRNVREIRFSNHKLLDGSKPAAN